MPSRRFKFRLEPLLKVRAHREKERQRDLAVAISKVDDQKTALTLLDHEREATVDSQRKFLQSRIVPSKALTYSRFLLRLKKDRLAGGQILHGLEREAEKKRMLLLEASKKRKTFETLKDKQQERYYRELGRDEQKELDEIATMAHARKKAKP